MKTQEATSFVKHNDSGILGALQAEARGLDLMREAISEQGAAIAVPQVLAVDDKALRLQGVTRTRPTSAQWRELGAGLAAMHRASAAQYGLDHDNTIGLNPQFNGWSASWGEFFVQQRLQVQLDMLAVGRLREQWQRQLDAQADALIKALDASVEQPSLVHGDLWSGNAIFSAESAWLIDPAVYYGDREVDLAMSEMFGGFAPEFYAAYDAAWPRREGYAARRDIYNLYHYLNHLNLFGGGYQSGCEAGFRAITALLG